VGYPVALARAQREPRQTMSLRQPLRLEPVLREKVWGGERLRALMPTASEGPSGTVGEAWCVVDREEVSSVVAEGAFAGRSLRGLMLSEQDALLGSTTPDPDGAFPLLVKLIDTRKNLSVQVHPDEATARRLGSQHAGKDESWLVLEAEPGSEVFLGLAAGVDARAFAEAGSTAEVVDLLQVHPVHAGDLVQVPAGTVHAIGAGLLVAEVQQNSDTTFRIYDWDRVDRSGGRRPTNLEDALQAISFDSHPPEPGPPAWEERGANRVASLTAGQAFETEVLRVHEPMLRDLEGFAGVVLVLEGRGSLRSGSGDDAVDHAFERGQTWLLPADLGAHCLLPGDGDFTLLSVRALRGRGVTA
jgi:mannose-6-phosphate isomerase